MRKFSRLYKALVIFLLITVCFTIYVFSVGFGLVADMCSAEIKAEITNVINESNDILNGMDFFYDDYFTVNTGEDGKVRSISANTGLINQVNMIIQTEIQNRLNEFRTKKLYLNSGVLTGSTFLAQYGREIGITTHVVCDCHTKLVSELSRIGINNTLHRLQINCYITVTVLVPTRSVVEDVDNEILITESIISGDVPSTYLGENTPTDYLDLLPN